MFKRRRIFALAVLGGTTMLMVAGMAAPASAEVIQGPCTGSAQFSNGAIVTESTPLDDVIEVPDEDTVIYSGDTHLSPPDEPEGFSGDVSVRLPIGGSWVVVNWPVPSGETESVSDAGTHTYEVPGFVPRGTGGLEVTAFHTQRGQTCMVAFAVTIEGSPGPAAIIGATGTFAFAAGVVGAGLRKKVV
jgi:hypothetical protein